MSELILPPGSLSQSEDEAARRRREIREKLLRGEEIKVTQQGNVVGLNEPTPNQPTISVPPGKLASAEEEAARRRREIREKLLRGEEIKVTQQGNVVGPNEPTPNQPVISVPPGKLASFYWYERDPELLQGEIQAMRRYFPQFQLEKLSNGQLTWFGRIRPHQVRQGAVWVLQVIYANDHPNNNTYGGSIKVYSIEPDLDAISRQLNGIPHTLRDSKGNIYLCTARPEDVQTGRVVTTAASAISWAVKWIHAFELWMAGDLSTQDFAGHKV